MKLVDTKHNQLMAKALDAYAVRRNTIASNIANIDTPGYKRLKVNFEDQLQNAMQSKSSVDPEDLSLQVKEGREQPVLEHEMMDLADTQIRVQMVTKELRHQFSLIRSSILSRSVQ